MKRYNRELHHWKGGQQNQSPPVNRIYQQIETSLDTLASNIMSLNLAKSAYKYPTATAKPSKNVRDDSINDNLVLMS